MPAQYYNIHNFRIKISTIRVLLPRSWLSICGASSSTILGNISIFALRIKNYYWEFFTDLLSSISYFKLLVTKLNCSFLVSFTLPWSRYSVNITRKNFFSLHMKKFMFDLSISIWVEMENSISYSFLQCSYNYQNDIFCVKIIWVETLKAASVNWMGKVDTVKFR